MVDKYCTYVLRSLTQAEELSLPFISHTLGLFHLKYKSPGVSQEWTPGRDCPGSKPMGKPMIPVNAYGEIKFWSTSKNGESRGSFDDLRLFLKTKKARTNLKLGLVWGFELPRELSELNFLDTSKWCLQGNKNKQCFQNITDNCNIFILIYFHKKTRVILPVSTIPAIAANFSKSSSELSLEEAILSEQNS